MQIRKRRYVSNYVAFYIAIASYNSVQFLYSIELYVQRQTKKRKINFIRIFDCCTLSTFMRSALFCNPKNCSITTEKSPILSSCKFFSVENSQNWYFCILLCLQIHSWWLKINIPCIEKEIFCWKMEIEKWWTENALESFLLNIGKLSI